MLKLRKGKVLDNRKEKAWRETFYHLKFRPIDCIDSRKHGASTWPHVPMAKAFTFIDLKCVVARDA